MTPTEDEEGYEPEIEFPEFLKLAFVWLLVVTTTAFVVFQMWWHPSPADNREMKVVVVYYAIAVVFTAFLAGVLFIPPILTARLLVRRWVSKRASRRQSA